MPPTDPRLARRLDLGLALLAEGAADQAVEAFSAALELDPHHAEAQFCLAEAHEAAGNAAAAIAGYHAYCALDPSDRLGAEARLARLGAVPPPARLPPAYLRTLFNQYAGRFDEALRDRLGYCVPELLRRAVDAVLPRPEPALAILDLGCGTGLAGTVFRDRAARLDGVDLSPEMIARARARGIYDRLHTADLVEALATAEPGYDLILAADVLIYLGDLAPTFAAVARALRPGGLFALSVEHAMAPGYRLGDKLRFAHSADYLRTAATAAGLAVISLEPAAGRTEGGNPVPGLIVVLRRPA